MYAKNFAAFVAAVTGSIIFAGPCLAAGDPQRGAADFGACAPCHSVEPDRNMTGPSLAGVWGRKAGSLASFDRYSPALKSSSVIWDAASLDRWLRNPAAFIPGSRMTFRGISDAKSRADITAYLAADSSSTAPKIAQAQEDRGGMMGGMGRAVPDLKSLTPSERVTSIAYCRDTYRVTTADGRTQDFWERNLRIKSDSGGQGPKRGEPALVAAGMMGDRADLIFASPAEITAAITTC